MLPSPYPYWGDEEDVQSPPRDPFLGSEQSSAFTGSVSQDITITLKHY